MNGARSKLRGEAAKFFMRPNHRLHSSPSPISKPSTHDETARFSAL